MKNIIKLIEFTNAFYESVYCIVNLEKIGHHRYAESKKQFNERLEDLIDEIKKK